MAIAPHLLMDWNLDECNRVLKNIQAMVNRGGTAAASPTVTQTMAAQSYGASSSGGSTPINLLGDASGTGTSAIDVTVQALQGVTVPIPISAEDGYFLQFNSSTGAYVLADVEAAIAYTNATPTPVTIGGIDAGTTFTDQTMSDMWDALLYPTLYPALVAPSSTFAMTESGYHEIGEVVATLHFSAAFNRGTITPAYGTSGYRSGLPNTYKYTGTGLTNKTSTSLTDAETVSSYTVLVGAQNWTGAVAFSIGEQPKDSKGGNYDSPLAAGDTATITRTITGVYPWYATSVAIATLTKQALASMSSSYVQVTMIAEDGVDKQKAAFPDGWSAITGVQFYNTVSSAWEWINGSKANSLLTWDVTAITETIQGNTIDYDLYTNNTATIGSRMLRWYTT